MEIISKRIAEAIGSRLDTVFELNTGMPVRLSQPFAPRVAVLIPCFNEASTIGGTVVGFARAAGCCDLCVRQQFERRYRRAGRSRRRHCPA